MIYIAVQTDMGHMVAKGIQCRLPGRKRREAYLVQTMARR